MARTISWLADSTGRPRRVVVWLHNDHARLGQWASPAGPVRAAGGLLRAGHPRDVFAVGFFMGQGAVANNSRATRQMLPLPTEGIEAMFERAGFPVGFVDLTSGSNTAAAAWGAAMQPYLRNGLAIDSMRPRIEFDALVYVSRVTPPTYRIP
jgi:erythromycin esterase-like protein